MTTYYVDATRGSDSNTGASQDQAWQSVAEVNAHRFQPGDEILFRAGDVHHQALVVNSSGTAEQPITFGAYGDGPAPVFDGSISLSQAQWTQTAPGSNVWTTSFTAPDRAAPDGIYVDDRPLGQKVADVSQVDKSGEWSWTASTGKLAIFSTSDPCTVDIEAQVESRMLKILGVDNVRVENLHFRQGGEGVAVYNAENVHLVNLEVEDNYTNGLEISQSTGISVEGGSYHDNGRITAWYNSGHGIVFNKGSFGNTVDGVQSYGNAEDGVQFFNDSGSGNVIRNSELFGNNEDGVDIKRGSQTIEASRIFDNSQEGINAHDNAGTTYIRGSVVAGMRHGLDVSEWARVVSSGNVYYGAVKGAVQLSNLYGEGSSFTNDIFTIDRTTAAYIDGRTMVPSSYVHVDQQFGFGWRDCDPGTGLGGGDTGVGTSGPDQVSLTTAVSVVDLAAGNDILTVGAAVLAGVDELHGGSGIDSLRLAGGGSFDLASGIVVDGFEKIVLADGGSLVLGDGSTASVEGSAAVDQVRAGAGAGLIAGLGGDDTLEGGAGGDTLDGGAGNDTASYLHSALGVKVDLALGTAQGGDAAGDRLVAIENLAGSHGDDQLLGNADANVLSGDDGNDRLSGRLGNDSLLGGAGRDMLCGDAGSDTISGGADADIVVGGGGCDVLFGDDGNDVIRGNAGADVARGGLGDDVLAGGTGRDALDGDAGNDTLCGGRDADILAGGAGNDTFVFAKGEAGGDVILDFQGNGAQAGDSLEFDGYGGGARLTHLAGSTWAVIDGASVEAFTIQGVTVLDPSDFHFV